MDDPTIYCEWLTSLGDQPLNTFSNAVFLISAYLSHQIISQSKERGLVYTITTIFNYFYRFK